ncbi:MAG: FeoA family protein [Paenibacillaceae bacterium]
MTLLSELKLQPGNTFYVKDLSSVDPLVRRRLCDMGVIEECLLRFKGSMPFGGPFMFECNGQRIGLRRKEAAYIEVEC